MHHTSDAPASGVPLGMLRIAPENPRQTEPDPQTICDLAVSIEAYGVMTPLIGYNDGPHTYITAGGRRLRALTALRDDDDVSVSDETPIPVQIMPRGDAIQAGIAEQLAHVNLTALDEFRIMQSGMFDGMEPKDIAKVLGRSQTYVMKRLAILEKPTLAEAVAAGDATVGQAVAISVLPEGSEEQGQALQTVRYRSEWSEEQTRAFLNRQKKVWGQWGPSLFVSEQAYVEQGGTFTGDLFSDVRIIDNPEIVEALVKIELPKLAREQHPGHGLYLMVDSIYGNIKVHPGVTPVLTEEEQADYDELYPQRWSLEQQMENEPASEVEENSYRWKELQAKLEPVYPPELTQHLVCIDEMPRGPNLIARPHVLPADGEALQALYAEGWLERPAEASTTAASGPSNALLQKILRIKLHALRMELAKSPNVVLQSYARHMMGSQMGYQAHPDPLFDIRHLNPEIEVSTSAAWDKLESLVEEKSRTPDAITDTEARNALAYHALVRLTTIAPINRTDRHAFEQSASDIRRYWCPDAKFLKGYDREVLNRMAVAAGMDASEVETAKKAALCEALAESASKDNSWLPEFFE